MCTYLVGKDYLGFTVDWLFVHSHFWDIVHHHFIPLVHLLWLNLCLGSNWIVQTDIKNDCNLLSWYPYVSCFEMSLYWLKQGAVFYSYISSTKIIKDLGLVVTIYKIKYITKIIYNYTLNITNSFVFHEFSHLNLISKCWNTNLKWQIGYKPLNLQLYIMHTLCICICIYPQFQVKPLVAVKTACKNARVDIWSNSPKKRDKIR